MQKNTYQSWRSDSTGADKSCKIFSDVCAVQNPDAVSPIGNVGSNEEPVIYVVIPVFNRIEETLSCIDCLKAQNYPQIKIIVSDGGSTDGTPQKLREEHQDIIVLESADTLWWGGATRMGIERALNESDSERDFVMMLNNDTLFDPDYVSTIFKHSCEHNAAVCGMVVDSADRSQIIDAGVSFSWPSYSFIGTNKRPQDEVISLGHDVLPGRATLIPIRAIRAAGNVDERHFPHYLSDYEFTYRLKHHGNIGLAVAYDAEVRTKVDPIAEEVIEASWIKEVLSRIRLRFSRRSKRNCMDHYWFIQKHAPTELKTRLLFRWFAQNCRYILTPISERIRNQWIIDGFLRGIRFGARSLRRVWRLFFGPYLINIADTRQLELDFLRLNQHKIIEPSRYKGYFIPARPRRYIKENYPEALALYRHASSPGRKLYRFLDSRGRIPSRASIRAKMPSGMLRFGQRIRAVFGPYLINIADTRQLELDLLHLNQHKKNEPSGLGRFRQRIRTVFGPYLLKTDDCYRFGLGLNELLEQGFVAPSEYLDYYYFTEAGQIASGESEKIRYLRGRARRLDLKIERFIRTRGQNRANRLAMKRIS